MKLLAVLLFLSCLTNAQPVVTKVANAASLYVPPVDESVPGLGVAGGSIIAIFGSGLAPETALHDGFPLPNELAGTSVTIGDLPAPLFYVSPTQVNAVVPNALAIRVQQRGVQNIVRLIVRTGGVASASYPLRITAHALGAFTVDGSGCGQGLIYQVAEDGTVSVNGPANSAEPDKSILTALSTGGGHARPKRLDQEMPADGEPAPYNGLISFGGLPFLMEQLTPYSVIDGYGRTDASFDTGRAPGLVGIDFVRFRLPHNVAEGCAVPLRLGGTHYTSQNVTMAIRRGGGQCVDPPVESIAVVSWERTVISGLEPESITEELRLDFLASSGKTLPVRDTIPEGARYVKYVESEGPSCPLPQDRRLRAGRISVQGPGWGPQEIQPDEENQYRVRLPSNAIRAGTFVVRASGGEDVGPFETSLRIPPPIAPDAYPVGTRIPAYGFFGVPDFRWSGGGEDEFVRVAVLSRPLNYGRGDWLHYSDTNASKQRLRMPVTTYFGLPPAIDAEIHFTQDAVTPVTFLARGLSRGGLHRYIYRWRFTGIVVKGDSVE
jgi:uncharacterized protein (TIGR03437 family)